MASFNTVNSTNPYQIAGTNVLSMAGANNLFVGSAAGASTTGSGNTATGDNAGLNLTSGSSNIMVGYQAGQNFTSNESNNIDIGNQGVAAESGVIRVGTAGTQNAAFIAGINGATGLSNPVPVVIDPATGQLGTGNPSAGGTITGVTAGTGLTGGGAGGNVSLTVNAGLVAFQSDLTTGINTAESFAATAASTAQANAVAAVANYANSTFLPLSGGTSLTGGLTGTTASFSSFNSTNPYQIGGSNVLSVAGANNLLVGSSAGANTTGSGNTAAGDNAGLNLTTGSSNIMVGYQAGQNFTSNESNNIDIGNQGVAAESGVTRIGAAGAQNAAFIARITGVTPAGANPLPVVIDSHGQLGTGTLATGTITGVTAGAGLTGGGASGNVSLSIGTAGVTNSMLASPSLTVTAGPGLTGGGSVTLGGSTTVSLAANSCANGYAVQGLPLTCTPVAGRAANTFTATQTVSSGDVSLSSGNLDLAQNTAANVGVITMGGTPFISACCSVAQQSTFLGLGAGNFTLTGNYNTGTGYNSLAHNTTGADNTASGASALANNTTGTNNTAIGAASLYQNTTASGNTAVGYGTLLNNTNGGGNTVIGDGALFYNTSGNYNTSLGGQALASNTTGSYNESQRRGYPLTVTLRDPATRPTGSWPSTATAPATTTLSADIKRVLVW
jgi:hypothetical protein